MLLSLLLFFQLGNEWALAGWLPLFLSQRLGISPVGRAADTRAVLVGIVGRAHRGSVDPAARPARVSIAWKCRIAIFGCVVLSETNNQFGAISAVLMVGVAFAPIYPLVVEKIGHRFPYYHPGYYNGVFSFAMAGGLIAPCILGLVAKIWGVGMVMLLPLTGSMIVFVLLLLIWLEARLSVHAQLPREAAE